MNEVAWGLLLLAVLLGASAAGFWLQARLQEHHRSRETTDAIRTVIVMIVTFAALVLGLLVTSVKADFDDHTDLYRRYGVSLIRFDERLREYGSQAEPIRQVLRIYAATVIAVTWTDEPAPPGAASTSLTPEPGGDETPALTAMLLRMEVAVNGLAPADLAQRRVAALLEADLQRIVGERWTLVERSVSRLSPIFIGILMFWLVIVFVVFGISSPRNTLAILVIGLSAVSIASSLYLALDLDTPVGGFITVSSQPIRDALRHIDAP